MSVDDQLLIAACLGGDPAAFGFLVRRYQDRLYNTVYRLLDNAGAAWVIPDRPGWRVPTVVTGGWSYLRFHEGGHAPRGAGYAREKLQRWADRIASFGPGDSFVYFNNDQGGAAVRDAKVLMELLEQRGLPVARQAATEP